MRRIVSCQGWNIDRDHSSVYEELETIVVVVYLSPSKGNRKVGKVSIANCLPVGRAGKVGIGRPQRTRPPKLWSDTKSTTRCVRCVSFVYLVTLYF